MKHAGVNVGEILFETLKRDIVLGRFAPSQKLRIAQLTGLYSASASSIREVLIRLTGFGLVESLDQRGFQVAPMSIKNLEEIAELRLLLESAAMRHAFARSDVDWRMRIVAAHHRLSEFEAALAAGKEIDRLKWKTADWQFHEALISACDSELLLRQHRIIFSQYLRYQVTLMAFKLQYGPERHAHLLQLALAGDAEGACELLQVHIMGGLDDARAANSDLLTKAPVRSGRQQDLVLPTLINLE